MCHAYVTCYKESIRKQPHMGESLFVGEINTQHSFQKNCKSFTIFPNKNPPAFQLLPVRHPSSRYISQWLPSILLQSNSSGNWLLTSSFPSPAPQSEQQEEKIVKYIESLTFG